MTAQVDRAPPATTAQQLSLTTSCPSIGVASVAVTGEVDLATAAALNAALLEALATYHPAVLDVDLSACTFLDCSCVRVLFAVHARATATGCLVRVHHPQPMARLVLEMTGLLALMTAPFDANGVATTAAAEHGVSSSRLARVANLPTVLPV